MYPQIDALPEQPIEPVATLGNFDGVHRGHQAILARIKEEGERLNAPTMVITFHPHPRQVLLPERSLHPLMSLKERLRILWDLGVDHVLVIPFDLDFAQRTATEFVEDILWERLRLRAIYVGRDTAFGQDRQGDVRFLSSEGRRLGFATGLVEPVLASGGAISSSRIRDALARADMGLVAQMLGRHHSVVGQVVRGEARGRELGFPTANLFTDGGCLPPGGVYASWATLESGERQPAVVNIGERPTFGDGGGLTVEAHLIGFEGDLYDQELRLAMVHRIRGEQDFHGPEQLKQQIGRDVAETRERLHLQP